MQSLINSRRIQDYPRLIFLATWVILAANLLLRQGWLGGLGQIIGSDFITLYASGIIYRSDIDRLYDFNFQEEVQQILIDPTTLPGVNPFISPPYVAHFYSLFTHIPLTWAFVGWSMVSLLFILMAACWLAKIIPEHVHLTIPQLLVILLGTFPFVEGFQVGQNHTLTLLLFTGMAYYTIRKRPWLGGLMAGLLLYKPQLIIGFLILWIIWRNYKSLASFGAVVLVWIGSFALINGIESFQDYLETSRALLLLPFIEGFPGYLLVTPYGLLTSLLSRSELPVIQIVTQVISIGVGIATIYMAFKFRRLPLEKRAPAIILSIIFPLIATPYALLHDLLILAPALVLCSYFVSNQRLLHFSIWIYLGSFFLTPISMLTEIALVALIPLSLILIIWPWNKSNLKLS
jgi:hypothetical protein